MDLKASSASLHPGPSNPVGGTQSSRQSKLTQYLPFLRTKKGVAITVVMLIVIVGAGLSGLAALHRGGVATASPSDSGGQNIASDTFFYGQSPPVYPSPNMIGGGRWADAFSKAQSFVAQLTLDEKVNLTTGAAPDNNCAGVISAIPRLGFPGLCLSDAGNGLRQTDFVSAWPSGIHVAASWNKNLTYQRGYGMGGEFKKKGVNVLLGPVVSPAGRVVLGGRIWESFSIDPYLSGALVYETVDAIQKAGVITSVKHFVGNEQETNRNPLPSTPMAEAVSSNIDDKTIHELYLWPFQDAVHAGTANIMCSYNRLNNSYGCANSKTLNGLLKTELGYQGFVVSDWDAQHAGVATALAGLDMTMPGYDSGLWGSNLRLAVTNGSVPETRLDDMATRIMASWYRLGQDLDFPAPGIGMSPVLVPHQVVDGRNSSDRPILLEGAIEGHVLVKNVNKTLPLKSPRLLSILGYSAKNPDSNHPGNADWSEGSTSYNVTEIVLAFSSSASALHSQIAINGTLYSGGGSGGVSQSLVSSPFDAIASRAWDNRTELFWDFSSAAPAVAPASDAALVIVNAFASEGFDRPGTHDDYSDGLIKHVASQHSNTIVVIHNAGTRLVDQFIDNPNVTAVIFAHLPGEASGKALVSLLWGDVSPSGKLPYTVARNESDYGDLYAPAQPEGIYTLFPQSDFAEGVFVDYRHFDVYNITPRYEFGFGLSYTTFAYNNLAVAKTGSNASFAAYPTGAVVEGGQSDLWDVLATVTADVSNTGGVAGAEVAQLYIGIPVQGAPVRQLRGFEKRLLQPGERQTVSFALTRRDLSVWDTAAQKWRLPTGTFGVFVGASSRDLPLSGSLVIGG